MKVEIIRSATVLKTVQSLNLVVDIKISKSKAFPANIKINFSDDSRDLRLVFDKNTLLNLTHGFLEDSIHQL